MCVNLLLGEAARTRSAAASGSSGGSDTTELTDEERAYHDDTELSEAALAQLDRHLQPAYYSKATAEALADNAPSATAAAWARPPALDADPSRRASARAAC
jgi:hypothetical protein